MIWLVFALVALITVYTIRKFRKEQQKLDAEEKAATKIVLPDNIEMPMMERDYLLRYLESFAKALSEVLTLRKDMQLDEALRTINNAFAEEREAKSMVDLPLDEFLAQVDYMKQFDAQKWALVAELLFERAEILREQSDADPELLPLAYASYTKAMHLALEVLLSDPETYRQRTIDLVKDLQQIVSDEYLPPTTLASLSEYRSGMN